MIWIIGGTSEAAELTKALYGKADFIVSSATESEREFIPQGKLFVGRMDKQLMEEFIKSEHVKMIVDMSHPYAAEVTQNAVEVSKKYNLKYIRYVRDKISDYKGCIYVDSLSKCIEFIKNIKGTVFFTTGMKNICDFEKVKGNNRFIYRVLPATPSIKECEKQGVKLKDIVAALGPYSEAFNRAMFKEYSADYVIMKDSGTRGGTLEKLEACRKLNIKAVIIGRNKEEGIYKLDELIDIILNSNL